MERKDILAFSKLAAAMTGNDLNNISGSTLSEIIDNCVMTVVLKDGNEASKVSYVKSNDHLVNPKTGTYYTAVGDNFDYWKVVSADTNQQICKCYNRSLDIRITENCSIIAVYKNQQMISTVSLKDGNNLVIHTIVPDNKVLVDSSNNYYKATGENFSYWSMLSPDDGREFCRCYSRYFNMRITNDCIIVAVYNTENPSYFTGISDPRYTRKKYTDTNGDTTDDVYADFLVQFDTSDPKLTFADIVKNSNGKIKFGIALERDTKAEAYTGGNIIAPQTNADAPVSKTIQDLYKKGVTKGWNSTTDKQLPQYNYYYYLYDLTALADDLSSFGRYEYLLKFNNSEENRARVYNVYTYIMVDDNLNNIIVSKPCVCSIYATGITDYDSTTMSTTNSSSS